MTSDAANCKTPLLSSTASTAEEANVEQRPLLPAKKFRVYKRRWWILFISSFLSVNMGMMWNTWSPITDAVQIAYGWKNSFTAILLGLSNLSSALLAVPIMYIIDVTDLGYGMVLGGAILTLSCVTWNIAMGTNQYWLVGVGAFINGLTGAYTLASPSVVSVTWFPSSERTTATSVVALSNYLGTGLAYLSGPYISGADVTENELKNKSSISPGEINHLRSGVLNQVYLVTGLCVTALVLAVIYYPPRPPTPPSSAQAVKRESYWPGLKHLIRSPNFWLLNMAYNIPNGFFNAWLPLCSINFRSLGVDEVTSGWIGFTAIITSCASSVLVSKFMDNFKRKMKLFLLFSSVGSLIIFIVLLCIQEKYIYIDKSNVKAVLYALCAGAALFTNGVIPLYYELACESSFPIDEGLTCSLLASLNNTCGIILFLLFLNPTLAKDTEWMTWACAGASALSIPMLVSVKEHFYRLDLD